MGRSVFIYLCLTAFFRRFFGAGLTDTPTLGSKNTPRILSDDINGGGYVYPYNQRHSVFMNQEDSEELYVGATDLVLKLNLDNYRVTETCHLNSTGQHCYTEPCENVITVIEKFQGGPFVCGTNANKPQCWRIFPSVNNQSCKIEKRLEGTGISPFVHTQNSLSLTVEGDLYAAAPLEIDGSQLQFRRKAGSRTNVWMHDSWVSEPTFISASWVKRNNDPDNEKIYIFFQEKNSDLNPEADPWISRVARVCKVDEGGSKSFLQNMWTSFLKARLVCGFPEESLYFNHLHDVYVMHAEDWRDTRVYALFTSGWNSTAVCIYSIAKIEEEIFEKSTFKGYNEDIPEPRPGTCVRDSKSLPRATVNVVKDYPEMTEWVHSLHHKAPFYVSSNNYTKIVVDQVLAADKKVYNVLLLATDSGKIHKVLEAGSEPFIISETQLSNSSSIQAMKLDSKKKKLVVGFSDKISIMDLQRCQQYNNSCADCILARDPYCAWTTLGCTPNIHDGIQNIMDGQITVCATVEEKLNRSKRDTQSASLVSLRIDHSAPRGVPFYLSCPINSYHAEYTWEHGGSSSPCLQMLSNCLHLIPSMEQENYGEYKCVSKERDYTKVVKTYHLTEQIIPVQYRMNFNTSSKFNDGSALVPQTAWITLLVVALWGILR